MKTLEEYYEAIPNLEHREIFTGVINWVLQTYPDLYLEMKWNQPMILDHGTFIISFWPAQNHMSVALETTLFNRYRDTIEQAGYKTTKKVFQIRWTQEINNKLLQTMIDDTILEKKDYNRFWL